MPSRPRVALVHDAELPVARYGGTERAVWWLAKGLSEAGISVTLVCRPGSRCPFARVVPADFGRPISEQVDEVDLYHFFNTPSPAPERPYLVTIQGNGKTGETFLPNTVFISGDHARRHGASCFVYNGLDPDDYDFRETKRDYLTFLAKASWKVKNVRGAIRIALGARRSLHILGGNSPLSWFWKARGIHWEGMVGGRQKTELLADSAGLLFPVLWHEPFGIAVTEALVSGTPVLATPYGSLPELVPPQAGALCVTDDEFVEQIARLPEFRPRDCRDWAVSRFHYREMVKDYLVLYEKVARGETLNVKPPVATAAPLPDSPSRHRTV